MLRIQRRTASKAVEPLSAEERRFALGTRSLADLLAPAAVDVARDHVRLEYQYARALIVVGYGIRLPDDFVNARWVRYEIGCEEVIDPLEFEYNRDTVVAITQRYTAALERAIRRAPEQYFWIHRRWKTEPGETARSRKQAKEARRAA